MKIKQVEELVGITSKNIRFYEDQGLVTPKRASNDYREYHKEEIDTLKKIKLLRKIGVSVDDIKKLFRGNLSLNECMEQQMVTLKREQSNLANTKNLVELIIQSDETAEDFKVDKWLETVEKLEKEGTKFLDLTKEDIHMKKKKGAFLSGLSVGILLLLYLGIMLYAVLKDGMPVGIFIAIGLVFAAVIICIVYVVNSRIKEIEGGEEDEASKY